MALRVLVQFQQFWRSSFFRGCFRSLGLCRGAFGQLLAFGSHSLLDVTTLSSATTCPVLLPCDPVTACDPRMGATTVSSMDGHIWRWAGNIPPGFEPEFEPRLAHLFEMLHIYMVLARLCKTHTYPVWGMTDAALLDYNIFNCCLLRDLLAAAAQGSGAVLAVLV